MLNPQEKSSDSSKFYTFRRRFIDDILFNTSLSHVTKLVGVAIAYSVNRETRATYEGYSRFAQRLGLKLRQVREAAEQLKADGRLRIEQRYGKLHLMPVLMGDAPHHSTGGPQRFYGQRSNCWKGILEQKDLSPATRVAFIGIAALTDATTGHCAEGQAQIGELVGISRRTMTTACRTLWKAKFLVGGEREGDPDILAVLDPTQSVADRSKTHSNYPRKYRSKRYRKHPCSRNDDYRVNPNACAPTLGTCETVETNETTPVSKKTLGASGRRGPMDAPYTQGRFEELVAFLDDDCRDDDGWMTIGRIITVSGLKPWEIQEFTIDEILLYVRHGLLERDKQRVRIASAGRAAIGLAEAA